MAGYKMQLNKKYIFSTIGKSIIDKKVTVIGIINYNESLLTNFDVRILALNEKVTDTITSEEYFKNKELFKCAPLDDPSSVIIVWSDIIDNSKTSVLDDEFVYKSIIKIPSTTVGITESFLLQKINELVLSYGCNITINRSATEYNSEVDALKAKLLEYDRILRSLNSLSLVAPILDKLSSDDLNKKIVAIESSIDTINDKLEAIAVGLS